MADCSWFDIICKGKEGVTEMAGNAVAQLAEQVMVGVSNVLVSLGTAWIHTPSINLESNAARKFITEHVQFLVLALLAGAIIMVGIRIVWIRRLEPLQDIMAGVFQFLVVSLGGIKIMSMLIDASDELSAWFIDQSVGSGEFGTSLLGILAVGNAVAPGVGTIVMIIGGSIALIANLIQVGLLFVRNALLILLAAVMVLPAAMPGSNMGKEWFKKLGGWFLAFVLFKPAASIIYATGITLVGSGGIGGGDELIAFAMGMLFLVLAPIALPALMAFIVPSVSALSAGGGGGAAGLAMAAGSAATGAANVASGSGGASGSESSSHSNTSDSSSTQSTSSASGASESTPAGTSGGGSSGGSAGSSAAPDSAASIWAPSAGAASDAGGAAASGAGTASAGSGAAASGAGAANAGGAAASGAAAAGTGGASMAIQAGVQGAQAVTGAVQSTVDSETGGATGSGQTDE